MWGNARRILSCLAGQRRDSTSASIFMITARRQAHSDRELISIVPSPIDVEEYGGWVPGQPSRMTQRLARPRNNVPSNLTDMKARIARRMKIVAIPARKTP